MIKRVVFSIILLLAAAPLLGLFSTTSAQSFTTITNLSTLTTQFTSTSQGFYTAGTSFTTSMVRGNLYSESLTLPATQGNYGCYYQTLPFSANKGQHLTGQVTSDSAIGFYILTEDSFKKWSIGRSCDVKADTLVRKEGTVSYTIDFTMALDGQYEFLFVNTSENTQANITIDVGIGGTSVTTIAQPIYSSTTQNIVVEVTKTMSSVRTEEVSSLLAGSNSLILLIIAAIVIIAVGFVAYKSFSGKKKPTGRKQVAGKVFCISCGAALPEGAKFCNKCGTTQ